MLLRKHQQIRSELGVSIPVPGSNDEFIETIFERLFTPENRQLSLLAEPVQEVQQTLFAEWDRAAEKEKRSRTRYAQHSLSTRGGGHRAKRCPGRYRLCCRRRPLRVRGLDSPGRVGAG